VVPYRGGVLVIDDPLSLLSLGIWLFAGGMWPVGFLFGACSACCNECPRMLNIEGCLYVENEALAEADAGDVRGSGGAFYKTGFTQKVALRRSQTVGLPLLGDTASGLSVDITPSRIEAQVRTSVASGSLGDARRVPVGETRVQLWRFPVAAGAFGTTYTPVGPSWHLEVELSVTGVATQEEMQEMQIATSIGSDSSGQPKLFVAFRMWTNSPSSFFIDHTETMTLFPTGLQRWLDGRLPASQVSGSLVSGDSYFGWGVTKLSGLTVLEEALGMRYAPPGFSGSGVFLEESFVIGFLQGEETVCRSGRCITLLENNVLCQVNNFGLGVDLEIYPATATYTFTDPVKDGDPYLCSDYILMYGGCGLSAWTGSYGHIRQFQVSQGLEAFYGSTDLLWNLINGPYRTSAPTFDRPLAYSSSSVNSLFFFFFTPSPGDPAIATVSLGGDEVGQYNNRLRESDNFGYFNTCPPNLRRVHGVFCTLGFPDVAEITLHLPGTDYVAPAVRGGEGSAFQPAWNAPLSVGVVAEQLTVPGEPSLKREIFWPPEDDGGSKFSYVILAGGFTLGGGPPQRIEKIGDCHYFWVRNDPPLPAFPPFASGLIQNPCDESGQTSGMTGFYSIIKLEHLGCPEGDPQFVDLNDGFGPQIALVSGTELDPTLTRFPSFPQTTSSGSVPWSISAFSENLPSLTPGPGAESCALSELTIDGRITILNVTLISAVAGDCYYGRLRFQTPTSCGVIDHQGCEDCVPAVEVTSGSEFASAAYISSGEKRGLIEIIAKTTWRGGEGVVFSLACGGSPSTHTVRRAFTVPDVPQNFTVTRGPCSVASLAWEAPFNGGRPITHYTIQYRPLQLSQYTSIGPISPSALTQTITELLRVGYEFLISATNDVGTSPLAAINEIFLGPPTSLAVTRNPCAEALLSWTAPAQSECVVVANYRLEYRVGTSGTFLVFGTVPGTQTTGTITGLDPTLQYQFRVARVVTGQSDLNSSTVTSGGSPSTPTAVVAALGASPGEVDLTWIAVEQLCFPNTNYLVQFRPSTTSTWSDFTRAASTDKFATVTGLTAGVIYFFRVRATNSIGNSGFSAQSNSLTVPAPE
jgi:hypothetical protein